MRQHKWAEVQALRGEHFIITWNNFRDLMSTCSGNHKDGQQVSNPISIWAVAHMGESVAGINAVIYGIVRYAYAKQITVLGARNGLEGLTGGKLEPMSWHSVTGITAQTASIIGGYGPKSQTLDSSSPETIKVVVETLNRNQVSCLLLVGDESALKLAKGLSGKVSGKKIVYIPAIVKVGEGGDSTPKELTITSGNLKLGFDSVLNKTCSELDDLGSGKGYNRLFLVRLNLGVACIDFVQPSLLATSAGATYVYPRSGWASSFDASGSAEIAAQAAEDAIYLRDSMLATGTSHIVLM